MNAYQNIIQILPKIAIELLRLTSYFTKILQTTKSNLLNDSKKVEIVTFWMAGQFSTNHFTSPKKDGPQVN